ncbi:hypothetical protein GCM10018793_64810 [Streptomyces sulfonofaciens]|uniref:Prenyltransferase n=1 Tax=Streptomyces sulfonofaciens TaxID=68272 RepID=A0A919GP32_9ACTN|nr:hypothetical protein GCM10018793_64810 [Streptomyces sulfonofaciens]
MVPAPPRQVRPAIPVRPGGTPAAKSSVLLRAEEFVRLTARILEQRRFAYHFLGAGNAGAEAVETALRAYRNEDEGYGHALDPGLRGPQSRPAHAVYALRVLDSIGRCGGQRVERLGRYLTAASAADGALPAFLPGRHPFGSAQGELLTTGPVVGLLHRNDVWHAWLFRATDFCWQAIECLEAPSPHEVQAAVTFLDSVPDRPRAQAAADRLGRLVREQRLAVLDPQQLDAYPVAAGCAPGAHHFPHDYAKVPESLARGWFTDDEIARSLDFLAADQQQDGGWPLLPSGPGGPPTERRWSPGAVVERLERRPGLTIEALRTLRAYGRPIG